MTDHRDAQTAEALLLLAVEKLGGELRIPLEALFILPMQDATLTSYVQNRELVLVARRLKPSSNEAPVNLIPPAFLDLLPDDFQDVDCEDAPGLPTLPEP